MTTFRQRVKQDLVSNRVSTVRRRGVVTACCPACFTANGVAIPMQYYDATTCYRCYSCGSFNRLVLQQEMVVIHATESVQKGVKVHGK